ncbi:MAG: porphobilinogen synthase [Pseudomonadota bacterium]
MSFPLHRPRRLRRNPTLRSMVRETTLQVESMIAPLFVVPGEKVKREIGSMPGQYQLSVDTAVAKANQLYELGVKSVILFAIPESKDEIGSSAWNPKGIIPQAIKAMKRELPELQVITDLCFCEYTSHGHCGVMKDGVLQNDETLGNLVRQSLVHAEAGADMIAPSGMLDGMVRSLRHGLDEGGFTDLPIMSYAAKFASAFYGPFREAVQSAPEYGDRKSYQMDPGNLEEAMREVALDIEEGADIIMVKPAMSFLDVVREVKTRFNMPTAVYNVSGEYAMIKAAAQKGWIDEQRVMLEVLTSMKRAGADIIITYFAEAFADLRQKGLA